MMYHGISATRFIAAYEPLCSNLHRHHSSFILVAISKVAVTIIPLAECLSTYARRLACHVINLDRLKLTSHS